MIKKLKYTLNIVIATLIAAVMLFHTSYIQKKIINNILQNITKKNRLEIKYENYYISLFKQSYIKNIHVNDINNNYMIQCSIDFELSFLKSILRLSIIAENIKLNGIYSNHKINLDNEEFSIKCDEVKLTITENKLSNINIKAIDSNVEIKFFKINKKDISLITESELSSEIIEKLLKVSLSRNRYKLSGDINYNTNLVDAKNVKLTFGENQSNFIFNCKIDKKQATTHLNIENSYINTSDIETYLPENLKKYVSNIKTTSIDGSIDGNIEKLKINLSSKTDIGSIIIDGNIINTKITSDIIYDGIMTLNEFHIGTYILGNSIDKVDLHTPKLKIAIPKNNNEIQWQKIQVESNIKVHKAIINNIEYNNADITCKIKNKIGLGNINISDDKLKLSGDYNFILGIEKSLMFKLRINQANLNEIGITTNQAQVSGDLNIKTNKFSNNLKVDATIKNLQCNLKNEILKLKETIIDVDSTDLLTVIKLNSTLLNANIEIKKKAINTIKTEDKLNKYTIFYCLETKEPPDNEDITNFYITPNNKIWGTISENIKSIYTTPIEVLEINDYIIKDLQISLDNTLEKQTLKIKSFQKKEYKSYQINNVVININNNLLNNKKEVYSEAQINNNNIQIECNLSDIKDNLHLSINNITLNNQDKWHIGENCKPIIINSNEIKCNKIKMLNKDQELELNFILNKNNKQGALKVSNFEINKTINNTRLNTTINGDLTILNPNKQYTLKANFITKDIVINSYNTGQGILKIIYDTTSKKIDLYSTIIQKNNLISEISGYYEYNKKNGLNLNIKCVGLKANFLNHFTKDVIKDISGNIHCDIKITGDLNTPKTEGYLQIHKGELNVVYLNTTYFFDSSIRFNNNRIANINTLKVHDKNIGTAQLSGYIDYHELKNLIFNVRGSFNNIELINLKSYTELNPYFYGSGIGTGTIEFLGTVKGLQINIKTKTEKNTNTFIDISIPETTEEYITYIKKQEKVKTYKSEDRTKKSASWVPNINLEVDLTPDTYQQITFGKNKKDTLQGQGTGKINITTGNNKPFKINGKYEFIEGTYSLNIYNTINKKFNIIKGSKILFTKDTEEIILDIKASHNSRVPLSPLLESTEKNTNTTNKNAKCNAEVTAQILGNIYHPNYLFNINITDYPNEQLFINAIKNFKQRISSDPLYLKNQIFNIVILQSFISKNQIINLKNAGQTISDMLTIQLEEFLSKINKNIIVNLDLDLTDIYSSNDDKNTQINLGYKFAKGKLVISKKTKILNDQKLTKEILDNWFIDYILNENKKIKLRLNINPLKQKNSLGLIFENIEEIFR